MTPTRVFHRYIVLQFLLRFAGLLAFFVVVLQMLDLLNKSEDILAAEGASAGSLIRYVSLRAPELASQFAPFAALLAVVLTLSMLSLSSQITVMRAAGMSAHRILFPMGAGCALVATAHFALHELAVIPGASELAYWEANDFAADLPPDDGTRTDLRVAEEGEVIHAGSAARVEGGVVLNDVTINRLTPAGLIAGEVRARFARFAEGEWRLFNARQFDLDSLQVQRFDTLSWPTALDPETVFALALDPERTGLAELWRKIRQLRRDDADAGAETTAFLSRFSKPLGSLVMPLLGAIAGFGVARRGAQLQRAALGAGLGFSYFVAENFMLALGKLDVVPAMLAAFFPFALFLVIGFSILLLMES
jgi:lipopolysaccharide export system permease protein